jgi:hypothetical protein
VRGIPRKEASLMVDAVELHVDIPQALIDEVLKRLFVHLVYPPESLPDSIRLRFLVYLTSDGNNLDVFATIEDLEFYAGLKGYVKLRQH